MSDLVEYPADDSSFEEVTIKSVKAEDSGGWCIERSDGWSFFVPADSPVVPADGMAVRFYGKGIGYVVRGLFLDGQRVFYRTEDEQQEHALNESYGKDAADLLARWDSGRSVWSIEMGGFGPGYEQALQIAAFEMLRCLLSGKAVDDADLSDLGLSGSQWGAAKSLATWWMNDGPRKVLEAFKDDRRIQVSKSFPNPELTRLRAENEALKGAAKPFVKLTARIERAYPGYADKVMLFFDLTHGDFRRLATLAQEKTDER